MSFTGGLPENQVRPGTPTTTVKNKDGEWISWDLIEEACNVPVSRKNDPSFLTIPEASRKFGVAMPALYARAKRNGWRVMSSQSKQRLLDDQEKNWGKKGEKHREAAFQRAHESLKKFRPRKPKDFKELEIADRIARRAAGLENESVVQQTLVHINEAVEDHAEAQVIEATEVTPVLEN